MASKSSYGLKFENKPENCVEQTKSHHFFLTEDPSLSFVRDAKRPHNLLIEGENYHALRILNYTHAAKIDVIEIDMPYNTGHKDFAYNDAFVDVEDTFRHSKWLSFVSRRLELAKQLLSDRGVIFLHIDHNEFAQLKMLCDRIFGEENFIENLIWIKKSGGDNDAKFIAGEHEYILTYARDINKCKLNRVAQNTDNDPSYKNEDEWVSTRGKYKTRQLDDKSLPWRANLRYPITCPDGTQVLPSGGDEVCWRWSQDKVKLGIEQGRIEFKKVKGVWKVYLKQYQFEDSNGNKIERSTPFRSVIDDILGAEGTRELAEIMGGKVFDYPKPVALIKRLIALASQKDSIVLDFFAGSGTVGQATAELNKEDGGTRQFILVTNNDTSDKLPQGICRQVTLPRLEKTIGNENLKYFRVQKLAKEASKVASITQLELHGRLVSTLCVLNNTFELVEKTAQSLVFTNHTNDKYLAIWSNTNGKQRPIDQKALSVFQIKLQSYPKCRLELNRPRNGFANEYFTFMSNHT